MISIALCATSPMPYRMLTSASPSTRMFSSKNVAEVFGPALARSSDNRVIASQVLPRLPADQAGIKLGAEIVAWDHQPTADAINQVVPYISGPSRPNTLNISSKSLS